VEEAAITMTPASTAVRLVSLEEDFEDVVRRHQRRIYRILYLILRDQDEADSLTQECFLRAYERRADFRGEAGLGTWLVRIAINLARDQQRSRRYAFWKRLMRGKDDEIHQCADQRRTQEDAIAASEKARIIWSVVDGLPVRLRTVFTLRFAEEMQIQEIAEIMKLREGTVKSHLFMAIRSVRRGLMRSDEGALRARRVDSAR
jgi:RNA polymerase sigma-70 factor (ECF subfamily)